MILMGCGGFGLAILLASIAVLSVPARFAATRVILSTFILLVLRHLFSIPVELHTNCTEGEGRDQWRRAIDRFVLYFGFLPMILIPLPLEVRLMAWRAAPEVPLFAILALACYEGLFADWDKLPLTCSYLPGKRPMWLAALRLFGLLAALPAVNAILVAALYNWAIFAAAFGLLAAIWLRFFRQRRQAWSETRLRYEDAPEVAIHTLNLMP